MQTPQDRTIKVGPINTRYWAEGDLGSPVILIHGLGGFAETWLLAFDALAAHHRVYAVDLPGHGRTDKTLEVPCQIADLAHFITNFMRALGIERAHLAGHSLGGAVTARFALMFPKMADKLVLVSSAGLGKELGLGLRLGAIPILGEILTRPSRAAMAQNVRALLNAPTGATDEAIDLWYEMASQPGAQSGILRTLRANANLLGQRSSQYGPIVAGLGSITHPALVIWGQQDVVVPVAHAQVAAGGLRNARVELLDHCGHIPMLEQPDVFNKLIVEFLGD
jgi:pimeloyl-ACP methyl ester carboxylesterase